MRRKDREMDQAFACSVTDRCAFATLSMADPDGNPYGVPISIAREGDTLYFHSAAQGRKVDCLRQNPSVCVSCVGAVHIPEGKFTTEYESSILFGRAEEVTGRDEKIHALRLICERYTPGNMGNFEEAIAMSLARTAVWRIKVTSVTGKRKKYGADGVELKFGRNEYMKRKIIQIDSDACVGCGLCAAACHEGAIAMVDGKAVLTREDYCDGLGDCLPTCPVGAISFEEREAPAYDHAAVMAAKASKESTPQGCPGTQAKRIDHSPAQSVHSCASELSQWPVQIKLAPVHAPYFDGANLLIAADCTAFAYGNFHHDFIRGHVVLIGCPKLDMGDYAQKLTEILQENEIKSLKVVRMEVPCCGGIEDAAKRALQASGKFIPWQVVTIGTDGRLLEA